MLYNSTLGTESIISNTAPASAATHANMICKSATASRGTEKSNIGFIWVGVGGGTKEKKVLAARRCPSFWTSGYSKLQHMKVSHSTPLSQEENKTTDIHS